MSPDWLGNARGLSPPRRGNHVSLVVDDAAFGSIPAQAGEPRPAEAKRASTKVYPRPGGGTIENLQRQTLDPGLSPPRRGNRAARHDGGKSGRSIPAQAGEPCRPRSCPPSPRVYPRPGGGTVTLSGSSSNGAGLSPPRRGNPGLLAESGCCRGSIPAQAGGTFLPAAGLSMYWGLSPPRRGNRRRSRRVRRERGSIPAQAGEPCSPEPTRGRASVYPRPSGGTNRRRRVSGLPPGLSPPRRGNLRHARSARRPPRSIPA